MLGLILILIFALMSAYILRKEIEEVLPPFVMTLLLGIYALILVKKAHHAFELSCVCFAGIFLVFVYSLIRRRKSIQWKELFSVRKIVDVLIAHRGFVIFLLACIWIWYAYSSHFVLVWDDFHYNATFPKDCFYYGAVPTGTNLATHYKSYLPLLQAFFYWGFQSSRTFSESAMFGYKMVLIYILLLPMFSRANGKNNKLWIPVSVISVIMPFLFLFEVQESLSMDTVMAALFAYAIIGIREERKDLYGYLRIFLALTCLTLVKTIAISFTAICLGLWFILIIARKAKKDWLYLFLSAGVVGAARMSWTVYCNRNGNTTYLTDILSDNISGGIRIPDYAFPTLKAMAKALFTMSVNLGKTGFSAFGMLIFVAIVITYLIVRKQFMRDDYISTIILSLGFVAYFALLVYTYIFVFEPWEADSLSSYDRYIGTYLFTVCYVLMLRLIPNVRPENAQSDVDSSMIEAPDEQGEKVCQNIPMELVFVISLAVVVLAVSLPVKRLCKVLIPSAYPEFHAEEYAGRLEVDAELQPFLDRASGSIMIVNNDENTMYSRSMDYQVIPAVSMPFNTTAYDREAAKANFSSLANEYHFDYIYFTAHEREYEDISVYELPSDYEEDPAMEGLYVRVR